MKNIKLRKKLSLFLVPIMVLYVFLPCIAQAQTVSYIATTATKSLTYYCQGSTIMDTADTDGNISSYLARNARSVIDKDGNISTNYLIKNGKDVIAKTQNGTKLDKTYQYTPYGKSIDFSASSPKTQSLATNPFRYSSYYLDSESGLYYLNARYYSPDLMRFISRDTYDLNNRYAYCNGNPIGNIDPNGHMSRGLKLGLLFGGAALLLVLSFIPGDQEATALLEEGADDEIANYLTEEGSSKPQKLSLVKHFKAMLSGSGDWGSASLFNSAVGHLIKHNKINLESDFITAGANALAFIPEYSIMAGEGKMLFRIGKRMRGDLYRTFKSSAKTIGVTVLGAGARAAVFEGAADGLTKGIDDLAGIKDNLTSKQFGLDTLNYAMCTLPFDLAGGYANFTRRGFHNATRFTKAQKKTLDAYTGSVVKKGLKTLVTKYKQVLMENSYYVVANATTAQWNPAG